MLCKLADIQLKLDESRAVEEIEARMAAAGQGPALGSPGGAPAQSGPGRTVSNVQLDVLSQQVCTSACYSLCCVLGM